MVRTKADAATARVSGAKAPRKSLPQTSTSHADRRGAASHSHGGGGGNPYHPRDTPTWQKEITNFFSPAKHKSENEGENTELAVKKNKDEDQGENAEFAVKNKDEVQGENTEFAVKSMDEGEGGNTEFAAKSMDEDEGGSTEFAAKNKDEDKGESAEFAMENKDDDPGENSKHISVDNETLEVTSDGTGSDKANVMLEN